MIHGRQLHRSRTVRFLLVGVLLVAATVLGARARSRAKPRDVAVTVSPSPTGTRSVEIPRARWRLADSAALDHVVLHLSHVLIRHREAEPQHVPFDLVGWRRLGPPNGRSREEAEALATAIAARARAAPERFAALAAEYSEDEVTRGAGGSLGGVMATDLSPWPAVLDAVAPLRPGDVSAVVETISGFHVLRRNPLPREQMIAARRLVIGYDGAEWLAVTRRPDRPRPSRSRDAALALAASLAEQARKTPAEFGRLINEYSEERDAADGGDIGVWSTREPCALPREIDALSTMTVGQISAPFDSRSGFEILQRTEVTTRREYAMDAIRLHFEAEAPASDLSSRASVLRIAKTLLARLAKHPEKFAGMKREAGGGLPEKWRSGRGPFGIERWLGAVPIGQIGPSPVESSPFIVIARRLDPATVPDPPPAADQLPSPAAPDMVHFVRSRHGRDLASMARTVGALYGRVIGPTDPRAAEVAALHATLAAQFETQEDADVCLARYSDAMRALAKLLGPGDFARYTSVVATHIEDALLRGRR